MLFNKDVKLETSAFRNELFSVWFTNTKDRSDGEILPEPKRGFRRNASFRPGPVFKLTSFKAGCPEKDSPEKKFFLSLLCDRKCDSMEILAKESLSPTAKETFVCL